MLLEAPLLLEVLEAVVLVAGAVVVPASAAAAVGVVLFTRIRHAL